MNPSDSTILNNDLTENSTETLHNEVEYIPIEKGATLLDLYEVKSQPIAGGMGQVFRVQHKGWNADLAMKQPQAKRFQNEEQKNNFIRECEAWINLGLHPHIVSCYYVREINGIPSVFAEWMDGGSLKDNIKNEKLYEGEALPRILDIAIQFARGLHYAHEQGLIHQDVKPDNFLLSSKGEAKVADFGLAKALAAMTFTDVSAVTDGTMYSAGGGYTPEYCSMEQLNGEILTRRTDIYSWAVTVLEMFMGERKWKSGVTAGIACEDYFQMEQRVPIPESMKDLLRHCFKENEAERPHDFLEIEKTLLEIYENETGNAYSRISPKAAADTADSLNNRALSFLDLGKPDEAVKLWEKGLELVHDHSISLYNLSVHLWKSGQIDDYEAMYRIYDFDSDTMPYYLAMIHISRQDLEYATKWFGHAKDRMGSTEDIKKGEATVALMKEKRENAVLLRDIKSMTGKRYDSFYVSHDESIMLAKNNKEVISFIDLKSGVMLKSYKAFVHDNHVSCCLNYDGTIVFTGSQDNSITAWYTKSGVHIKVFKGHSDAVKALCASLDGKKLLSGGIDTTVKLWNVETGLCIYTFTGHEATVSSVCFSPDGMKALSLSKDNVIKLWDIAIGQCLHTFDLREEEVDSVCFTGDGKAIRCVSSAMRIKLWNTATGQCFQDFKGICLSAKKMLCYSADGKLGISGGNTGRKTKESYVGGGGAVKVWNLETGQCLRTFVSNAYPLSAFFSKDEKSVYTQNRDDIMMQWAIPTNPRYEILLSRVTDTATFSRNKELFNSLADKIFESVTNKDIAGALTALDELKMKQDYGEGRVYIEAKKQVARYCVTGKFMYAKQLEPIQHKAISALSFSPDGKLAVTGNCTKTLTLWDALEWKCLYSRKAHGGEITAVCFCPDGKSFASGGHYEVMMWDTQSGECLWTYDDSNHYHSIDFSPDGKKILISGVLCNADTGKLIHDFGYAKLSCFSPDGKAILKLKNTGSSIDLLEIETRKIIRTYKCERYGNPVSVQELSISPDGKMILGSSMIWDFASGEIIRDFGLTSTVSACFSPNGKNVLYGDHRGMLQLLTNMKYGYLSVDESPQTIKFVSFSPDNTRILAVSDDKIHIYTVNYELSFPGWKNWDDGALPYVKNFLTLYPDYDNDDFDRLITDLQIRGYGWLRPEGVRIKLDELQFGW